MRKYYYSVGVDRKGPVTIEELKSVVGFSAATLVWYEGLSGWIRAGDVSELSELFAPVPPPVIGGVPYVSGVPPVRVEQKMFANPFSFAGRIRRLEYGFSIIISTIVGVSSLPLYEAVSFLYWFIFVINYWFCIAQGCKRSHDAGMSGWCQLIPLFNIYLLFAGDDPGVNKYGTNPKGE
jgi:uncharacterized membrane protein YhaH (DUF805 family)